MDGGGGVHKMYMKGRPSLLTFKRVQNLLSQTTSPSEVYIAMFSSGKIAMKMIKTCMVKMLKVFFIINSPICLNMCFVQSFKH